MTEFEERLTHEFSTLAAQYAQEQKRLSGQVARLEEQVRDLAAHYEQARQLYATWATLADALAKDRQKMGIRITTLTDAYETQTAACNSLLTGFNKLAEDLTELLR